MTLRFDRLRRRLLTAAAAIALASALPAGLSHPAFAADPGVSDDAVKVGSTLALSGTLAYMGKAVQEGMETYFGMLNDQGGVNGRRIELVSYDDEFKPPKAVANAKLLVERDDVLALVGPVGTATVLAAYEYLEPKGVPIVGALSISDAVTNPPRKLLFALPSPQSTEAPAYVDYAVNELGAQKVAMLVQNDAWGKPAQDYTEKQLATHGMKLVEVQNFERLATDLTSQVARLKAAEPDVVILYALGQQAAIFFKNAEKLGWNPTVFGAGGLNDPKFVELLGGGAGKTLYVASYYDPVDGENPAIKAFVAEYGKRFPKSTPSSLALMGYSAAATFAEALKQAGDDPTREKLVSALEGMKGFDQKIGPAITFAPLSDDPYSRRGQTGVVLMQLKDGGFRSLGAVIDPVRGGR
ncbi:ABC transporter substrate-binding protein [Tistrella mobilis]